MAERKWMNVESKTIVHQHNLKNCEILTLFIHADRRIVIKEFLQSMIFHKCKLSDLNTHRVASLTWFKISYAALQSGFDKRKHKIFGNVRITAEALELLHQCRRQAS